jgi:hypothetical protein
VDIHAARALKTWIRSRASGRFAVGLQRGRTPSAWRVSILLQQDTELTSARAIAAATGEDVAIEVTGPIRPATSVRIGEAGSQPLKIGASVGHAAGGVGSLGFFAARRADGARGFVSCNHVIARVDQARDGDFITSPAAVDGEPHIVGALDGTFPRLAESAAADCAFAVLNQGVAHDPSSLDSGPLSLERTLIEPGLEVDKVGRITSARPGTVSQVEVDDVWIRYGRHLHVSFNGVIVVAAASARPFCSPGDSGALVYSSGSRQPVGLLFASSDLGGPYNAGWTWIHPASCVEDALGVDLVNQ